MTTPFKTVPDMPNIPLPPPRKRGLSVSRAGDCSPRIVQLLMTPQDATWQNRLIGLGSDGVTYSVNYKGFWEPFVPPLGVTPNGTYDGRL